MVGGHIAKCPQRQSDEFLDSRVCELRSECKGNAVSKHRRTLRDGHDNNAERGAKAKKPDSGLIMLHRINGQVVARLSERKQTKETNGHDVG